MIIKCYLLHNSIVYTDKIFDESEKEEFLVDYRITSIKHPLVFLPCLSFWMSIVEAAPSFNIINEENDDEELEIL